MPYFVVQLPSVVLATSATASPPLRDVGDCYGITIFSPSTFTSTQITVQVEPTTSGTGFVALQSGGADVVVTGAKALVISPVPFKQLRLSGSATEATPLTFPVTQVIHLR